MTNKPKDGGPAFACVDGVNSYLQEGMSLRQYYAGQALAAMIANPEITKANIKAKVTAEQNQQWHAEAAVQFADALIAELEKDDE